jgi:predicted PhzF superfamily epimerase YddE/YHI9
VQVLHSKDCVSCSRLCKHDYLVEMASAEALRSFEADLPAIAAMGGRGVILTAKSGWKTIDFESRFFGPNISIAEDPVTGSAHCVLGPYWAEKLGETELNAYQYVPLNTDPSFAIRVGDELTPIPPDMILVLTES